MQNASIILEFPKIAQEVSFFAHSERGKESSLNLKRLAKDELIEELSYLKETIDLIARYGYLPIDSSADLRNVMEYASRGGVLSAHELEAIATDAKTLNNLRDYFKKVELSPLLIDYSKTLPILDEDLVKAALCPLHLRMETVPVVLKVFIQFCLFFLNPFLCCLPGAFLPC